MKIYFCVSCASRTLDMWPCPSPPDVSLFSQLAEERIGNIRTVRAFGKEMTEIEKYSSKVDFVMQLARKEAIARAGFFGAVSTSCGKEEGGWCHWERFLSCDSGHK